MKLEIWKYLEPILGEKDDIQVDLLTGANCVKALEPIKVISSEVHGPYAYKTVLGWCVVGTMGVNKANLKEVKCNNIYVHEANPVKRANHHFALKGPVREVDIATMLQRIMRQTSLKLNCNHQHHVPDSKSFPSMMQVSWS